MRRKISIAFLALTTISIILFLTSCVSRTIESTENLGNSIDIQPKEISYENLQRNNSKLADNEKIYIMTENPYEVTLDMIPESTKNAVHRALMGEDPTEEALRAEARRLGIDEEQYAEGGALFFYNPNACGTNALEEREGIKVKVSLGLHTFYKVWD